MRKEIVKNYSRDPKVIREATTITVIHALGVPLRQLSKCPRKFPKVVEKRYGFEVFNMAKAKHVTRVLVELESLKPIKHSTVNTTNPCLNATHALLVISAKLLKIESATPDHSNG